MFHNLAFVVPQIRQAPDRPSLPPHHRELTCLSCLRSIGVGSYVINTLQVATMSRAAWFICWWGGVLVACCVVVALLTGWLNHLGPTLKIQNWRKPTFYFYLLYGRIPYGTLPVWNSTARWNPFIQKKGHSHTREWTIERRQTSYYSTSNKINTG